MSGEHPEVAFWFRSQADSKEVFQTVSLALPTIDLVIKRFSLCLARICFCKLHFQSRNNEKQLARSEVLEASKWHDRRNQIGCKTEEKAYF